MTHCLETEDRASVRWIWMDRPAQRNAFHPELINALRNAFLNAASAPAIRAIVLAGRGPAFSAGADLGWMREAAHFSDEENRADAKSLATMLAAIRNCARPVIARVHGAALGGGVGLAAASDIAIASKDAWLQLSEVRLGLIPAVIAPYVIEALGLRRARQLMLSGERLDAGRAAEWGLVNEAVAAEALDARIEELLAEVSKGGPESLAAAKDLMRRIGSHPIDSSVLDETAESIARIRMTEEAQEGIAAFFDRRPPRWVRS